MPLLHPNLYPDRNEAHVRQNKPEWPVQKVICFSQLKHANCGVCLTALVPEKTLDLAQLEMLVGSQHAMISLEYTFFNIDAADFVNFLCIFAGIF